MKNKLVTKIILVAVCVSTLLVTFAVPSFAYDITSSSPIYNSKGETFNLPGLNAINLKNVSSHSDIPNILTCPIADYGSKGLSVIGGFTSTIDNTNSVTWRVERFNNNVNYYDTGYFLDGEFQIFTTHRSFDFDYYELDSIVLRDYMFSSHDDVVPGTSCSVQIDLYDPELFPQIHAPTDSTKYSLKVNYFYKYYDQDGDFHDDTFDTKIYPSGVNSDGATLFQLQYFPKTYYTEVDDFVLTERTAQNPIYTHDLVYLEELVITIDMEGYNLNFMHATDEPFTPQIGHFINRLNPSNAGSPTDLIEGSFDLGYTRGKSDGWSEGFQSAVDQGELNPFENVFNAINTFTSWEFIPGISVGVILSIVIGVSLLIAFLKIFAGG